MSAAAANTSSAAAAAAAAAPAAARGRKRKGRASAPAPPVILGEVASDDDGGDKPVPAVASVPPAATSSAGAEAPRKRPMRRASAPAAQLAPAASTPVRAPRTAKKRTAEGASPSNLTTTNAPRRGRPPSRRAVRLQRQSVDGAEVASSSTSEDGTMRRLAKTPRKPRPSEIAAKKRRQEERAARERGEFVDTGPPKPPRPPRPVEVRAKQRRMEERARLGLPPRKVRKWAVVDGKPVEIQSSSRPCQRLTRPEIVAGVMGMAKKLRDRQDRQGRRAKTVQAALAAVKQGRPKRGTTLPPANVARDAGMSRRTSSRRLRSTDKDSDRDNIVVDTKEEGDATTSESLQSNKSKERSVSVGKEGSVAPPPEQEETVVAPVAKVPLLPKKNYLSSGLYSRDVKAPIRTTTLFKRGGRHTRTEPVMVSSSSRNSKAKSSALALIARRARKASKIGPAPPGSAESILPLPIEWGATQFLNRQRDFMLPFEVFAKQREGMLDGKRTPKPYGKIAKNIYVGRRKLSSEIAVCACRPRKTTSTKQQQHQLPTPSPSASSSSSGYNSGNGGRSSKSASATTSNVRASDVEGGDCGADCLNRQLYYTCDPSTCPCGDRCTNVPLNKRTPKMMDIVWYGARGFGLRAAEPISAGSFVTEYRGEIITMAEASARITNGWYKKEFYFLDYDAAVGEVIDAGRKGNIARFANHSCDPNLRVEKWTISGSPVEPGSAEFEIGFFAMRDIAKGEELTYDYGWCAWGPKSEGTDRCFCGKENCSGWFGKKATRV